MNARYYGSTLNRFASADTIVPNPSNPQSYNRYSYSFNNPANFSDPSGLICIFGYGNCDEEDDLLTLPWRIFPNDFCLPGNLGCWGGSDYADWLQTTYTKDSMPDILRPDAVGVYAGIYGGLQTGIVAAVGGQTGIEIIFNLHSYDLTAFAVVGLGGAAGNFGLSNNQFMLVYNIEGNNLAYSGDFVGVGAGGAWGKGAGAQYSLTPEDALNPSSWFSPEGSYSIGVGPACGIGGGGWINRVEYIPIVTTNLSTNKVTYHLTDYLYDAPTPDDPEGRFNNGFITGLVTEDMPYHYNRIKEFIRTQGWTEGN
ncbi:MAG: hypothetical protein KC445_11410 [Anaerolineales bacterium]|nr:hypothetical protein [Anaerolineales bacterium]